MAKDKHQRLAHELFFLIRESMALDEMRTKIIELLDGGARATFELKGDHPIQTTTRMVAFHRRRQVFDLLGDQPILNLMDAAIVGDIDAIERFLGDGISLDQTDLYKQRNALSYAAGCGHVHAVSFLLDTGADPNFFEEPWDSPLTLALRDGHIETANLLWEADARAETLLFHVIRGRAPAESVAWIVDHLPTCDQINGLHQAIKYNNVAAVNWLLDAGVHVDSRRRTQTGLMTAADARNLTMVELLLSRGCDVHAVDAQGQTAMHKAIATDDHLYDETSQYTFNYVDGAIEMPVAKALLAAGLVIPARTMKI